MQTYGYSTFFEKNLFYGKIFFIIVISNNLNKVNNIKSDTNDNFGNGEVNEKEQFYRGQIVERDNQIEELRIRLEVKFNILIKYNIYYI